MLSAAWYWLRYRIPAFFGHKVEYKTFSAHTDAEFDEYNEARARHPLKLILLDWLRHDTLLGPKFSLMDIGCGPGVLTRTIFADPELKDRVAYTGVDQSDGALAYAKKRFPQGTFVKRDVLEAGLPEGEFDVVMINEVVEHMPSFEKAIDLAVAKNPKIFVLTGFAIMPEYGSDRIRWSPYGGCYMNSYSFARVQDKLRGIAGTRPMLMADLGSHAFERHWFPRKALTMFYVRLGAPKATLTE